MGKHDYQDEHPSDEILETISKVCVHLHQNRELIIGEAEASMRVSLGWALEKCGMSIKREIASTLLYDDMDQRENDRIYLNANDVVIDVRAIDAIGDYHRDQFRKFLTHIKRPRGLIVNFAGQLYEPELVP